VLEVRHPLFLGSLLAPLHEPPHRGAEREQVGVLPVGRRAPDRDLS